MARRNDFQKSVILELRKFWDANQGLSKPARNELQKNGTVGLFWFYYKPKDRTANVTLGVMLDRAEDFGCRVNWVHPNSIPWMKYVKPYRSWPTSVLVILVPQS